MTPLMETVRCDHNDLLSCVYKLYAKQARDVTKAGSYSLIHLAAGQEGEQESKNKCLKYLLE